MTPKIGIQAAPFSNEIHGGTLNAVGTMFLHKENVTDMALRSVADYVVKHYDGKAQITFGDGVTMTVEVTGQ